MTASEVGIIEFSKPITLHSLYLRSSNWKSGIRASFTVRLFLWGKVIYQQELYHEEAFNIWIPTYGPKYNITSIEIPKNTHVDSIFVSTAPSPLTQEKTLRLMEMEIMRTRKDIFVPRKIQELSLDSSLKEEVRSKKDNLIKD